MKPNFSLELTEENIKTMKQAIIDRLYMGVVQSIDTASSRDIFNAVSQAVMEFLAKGWLDTQTGYYKNDVKRVYYLSMEFLLGRSLKNNLLNLGVLDLVREALNLMGFDFEKLLEIEADAGLGNGGLGRLAACYLDSMATLGIPSYGYGLRYDYGIFHQSIEDGQQVELPDEWLRYGNPWEIRRSEFLYPVNFYGKVKHYKDSNGNDKSEWIDTQDVLAMAYDVPIPGYRNTTVNSLRLWQAQSPLGFQFNYFNHGNYLQAIQDVVLVENISRVLYPNDSILEGKELRLKQEYFLVSATIQDILRRYTKNHIGLELLPDKVAIQLNDTHPSLGIPELMRILIDREELDWDTAWDLTVRIFNYTNHTVMPEALERWPLDLFAKLLPRHLEIVERINNEWMKKVVAMGFNPEQQQVVSIIEKGLEPRINMANLAIVGSSKVNGVSAFHSELLKKTIFKPFYELYPDKFTNVTNGITPRRWIAQCNYNLNSLLKETIGEDYIHNLNLIESIKNYADDSSFLEKWQQVKLHNKQILAKKIEACTGIVIDPHTMFDCQIKRIHEYKRQLMNILRVINTYLDIKDGRKDLVVPTTVLFGGKAAPGYFIAKLIIKLINSVADIVNNDPDVKDFLKVVFYPNYRVSVAEVMIPATDLSEQISTAGMEASGTGNMKFALNGALTIGTMDGANIEMAEHIGKEHMFIFGLLESEINEISTTYSSQEIYNNNPRIKQIIDMIANGFFSPSEPNLFEPIIYKLLQERDTYFVLADLQSYINEHYNVAKVYSDQSLWSKKSIYNVAGMSYFSSDRSIQDYAKNIWGVPIH